MSAESEVREGRRLLVAHERGYQAGISGYKEYPENLDFLDALVSPSSESVIARQGYVRGEKEANS